jgi:hypothetical protein
MLRNMKKFVSLVLVLALSLTIGVPALAKGSSVEGKKYFQKTGQIDLCGIDLSIEPKTGKINIKQNKAANSTAQSKLEQQLLNNKELNDSLKMLINSGKKATAIGYTTVYLKEVTDQQGTHLEPMTAAEVNAAGGKTSKGLLSLYTSAYVTTRGSTKYVDAYSVAHWGNGIGMPSSTPASGDDFITMSLPSDYMLTDSSMSDTLGDYKHDEDYSSVVYGFTEWDGMDVAVDPTLSVYGHSTSSIGTKKFVSKYVHTWASVDPVFSISKDGVSISLGSESGSSWQIASSVNLSC